MRRLFAVCLLIAAACAHYPVNPKLGGIDVTKGYRWATTSLPKANNETFVVLAFSGGGTRAAGLSYTVLKQLQGTALADGSRLLDHVRVISSVSGGSFASMDYALRGDDMIADFETTFLTKDVEKDLVSAAFFTPSNWIKLLSPNYHRIDLAEEVYDRDVFHGKTFKDLLEIQQQKNRPYVIANSTELEMGSRFEWTQDDFDPICSDITSMHVARAVAASSCFPVLLPPLIVDKYDRDVCHYQDPEWVATARSDAYVNPARVRLISELEGFLNPERTHLHLMDGGIADNIGLRAPVHALTSTDTFVPYDRAKERGGFTLVPLTNKGKIRKMLIIVVNAGTQGPIKIDNKQSEPKLLGVIGGVIGAPMDNYSFDSIQLTLSTIKEIRGLDTTYYPVLIQLPAHPGQRQEPARHGQRHRYEFRCADRCPDRRVEASLRSPAPPGPVLPAIPTRRRSRQTPNAVRDLRLGAATAVGVVRVEVVGEIEGSITAPHLQGCEEGARPVTVKRSVSCRRYP